jgi:hypothetical protein
MNILSAEKASPYYAQFLPSSDAEILANGTAQQRREMLERTVSKLQQ